MYGETYVRAASSLTGKRVKKDPAFAHTMANAHRLGTAARLAVAVYDMLAPSRRKRFNYKNMVGRAIRLLKDGHTEGETVVELMIYIRLPKRVRKKRPVVVKLRPLAPVRVIKLPELPKRAHTRAGKTRLQTPSFLPGIVVRPRGQALRMYNHYG